MQKFKYGYQVCRYFDELYRKGVYSQFERYDNLIRCFKKRFGGDYCYLASSSGRVEIAGNHTDHNGGKVIGCAVNYDIAAAFRPNGTKTVRIASEGYSVIEFSADASTRLSGGVGLAEGVVSYLAQQGYKTDGVDIFTDSVLRGGIGMSSSAAYEMLIAVIVNQCFNDGAITDEVLAAAGQYAEKKYLNKPCGLLDQGIALSGGMAQLDFKNGFTCNKFSANADCVRFLLVDTGKNHAALSDLYASIPEEMHMVAEFFGKQRLCQIGYDEFVANSFNVKKSVGDRPYLRAKHFFEENIRVEEMALALKDGLADKIIQLINDSGDSSMYQLQNCAVNESDTTIADAVNYIRSLGNVGVRVHGGGFAGTVLCVVESKDFASVFSSLTQKYGEINVIPINIRKVGATVL